MRTAGYVMIGGAIAACGERIDPAAWMKRRHLNDDWIEHNSLLRHAWRAAYLREREAKGNRAEVERLTALLNTPEIVDFAKAVQIEAAHQRERWGSEHDAGKTDADWFWLIGYLAGKALHNPPTDDGRTPEEARLHRIITVAAAAANWHAATLAQKCTTGEGRCHGTLVWCDWCGDVTEMCDDPRCDAHREVWEKP